jgi:hypothetical protein
LDDWDYIVLEIIISKINKFVKALDPNSAALQHIREMFPRLSDATLKGGIFIGSQIRVMLACRDLE